MANCFDTDKMKEAVCVEVQKIYDSCKDRDCIENLRVYLSPCGQELLDNAISVKPKSATVIWVYTDAEPVAFRRGYYSVNLQYYFKLVFSVKTCHGVCADIEGFARYEKRCIMFGSEGSAKLFESDHFPTISEICRENGSSAPKVSVEVVAPIILSHKVAEKGEKICCNCCCCLPMSESIPKEIIPLFEGTLVPEPEKKLYVTLGLFSIIRLSRYVQLIIPAYDFCIPEKEGCCESNNESPCDLFDKFCFPVDEFFPPCDKKCKDCGC